MLDNMRKFILILSINATCFVYADSTTELHRHTMPWHENFTPAHNTETSSVNISRAPQARQDTIIESDSTVSEGRDFWVTFMTQSSDDTEGVESKVIISSKQEANVTIENPNTGWSNSVHVQAMQLVDVIIPYSQCHLVSDDVIAQKGIHIQSDAPITVFATNFMDYSFDATNALPATVLENQYILQTYTGIKDYGVDTLGKTSSSVFFAVVDTIDDLLFEFYFISPAVAAIVATDDNTEVKITPSTNTLDGHSAGSTYNISLNKGEVYQFFSNSEERLSGTLLSSNKKIAVYNGNICSNVPSNVSACDHLVEQAMPTSMWGESFVVTSSYGLISDQVVITAKNDNTDIYIDNTLVATINAYESYEFKLKSSKRASYIRTSEPVGCYLYISGGENNNEMSDPSMVWISPIEQRIRQVTFGTFETAYTKSHYVNIVTPTNAVKGMTLDGNNISSQFTPVESNKQLSYARIKISHATHILSNTIDGFVAHIYGLGLYESYAYNTGSATRHLTHQTTAEIVWDLQSTCKDDRFANLSYTITEGIDHITISSADDSYNTTFATTVPSSRSFDIPLYRHGENKYIAYSYLDGLLMRIDTLATYNYFPNSVLIQKWNDFIGVQTAEYNGGYNFTEFAWYKNGEQLAGETRSYIYQPLETGAQYAALLTDDKGDQAFTCPITATTKDDLTLYPTVTHARENIRIHTTSVTTVEIYTATGSKLTTMRLLPGQDTICAPEQSGLYIVKLSSEANGSRVYQLIVR